MESSEPLLLTIHFFNRLHFVVLFLGQSLKHTLLLFLDHLSFVLLQCPLQVLVLLLGPAESKGWKVRCVRAKQGEGGGGGGGGGGDTCMHTQVMAELQPFTRLASCWRTALPKVERDCAHSGVLHCAQDGAQHNLQRVFTATMVFGRYLEILMTGQQTLLQKLIRGLDWKSKLLQDSAVSLCFMQFLWVAYSFSWASRSLTSASRLLTRMTSSSSSSCSRLFWASVFCQSATTAQELQTEDNSQNTEETLSSGNTSKCKPKFLLSDKRYWILLD